MRTEDITHHVVARCRLPVQLRAAFSAIFLASFQTPHLILPLAVIELSILFHTLSEAFLLVFFICAKYLSKI